MSCFVLMFDELPPSWKDPYRWCNSFSARLKCGISWFEPRSGNSRL